MSKKILGTLGAILIIVGLLSPLSTALAYPAWDGNFHPYAVNDLVTYNGRDYRCQQAHTSQPDWNPVATPALWVDLGPTGGATPTRTNTVSGPTPTRTNTPTGPTPTRTNTPIGPTPTRTNTSIGPTPTRTNTAVPPPPSGSKVTAPYIDVSPGAASAIMNLAGNGSGNKHYTLAFILGRGCSASWFGTFELNTAEANAIGTRINELRAVGGDVIIAFGGAAAPELANVCPDVASLQAQYQAVINKYSLKTMDLDIEDFSPTAIDMRNKALKNLEAANPTLKVNYTLGVLPTGMTQAQLDVLNNAKANGTRVDLVNIMAMDYYQNVQDMGGAAIQAAQATRNQLNNMGFTGTAIGITPMIGRNDSPETFTLEDAQQVVNWANGNNIKLLAFWSVGRDNGGCPNGTVSPSCSGISQSTWQFSNIFHGFAF
jgi:hypothetical protein